MVEAIHETRQDTDCEREDCCSTTEDGSAVCIVPQDGQPASPPSANPLISISSILPVRHNTRARKSLWHRTRGGLMFAVACIASPCCTPLIVPLALALLAGTPVAAWLGHNLGWVYGGLTLLSVVSFVLACAGRIKNHDAPPNSPIPKSTFNSSIDTIVKEINP
jgi:hypothetical protein